MKEIVVDFDGTICEYAFPNCGRPTGGVREALSAIKELGYLIILHSCRTSHYWVHLFPHQNPIDQLRIIENYMVENNLPYDRICLLEKPVADYYIDDRGISFRGDWDSVIKELKLREGLDVPQEDKSTEEAIDADSDQVTL